jgi:hypothetical protein
VNLMVALPHVSLDVYGTQFLLRRNLL